MGAKLYVGNLSYSATSDQIKELFATYGDVTQVNIIDGKGFGFVEMGSPDAANKAKDALNGQDFMGRNIKVDEARPPQNKPRGNYGDRGDRGDRGGDSRRRF